MLFQKRLPGLVCWASSALRPPSGENGCHCYDNGVSVRENSAAPPALRAVFLDRDGVINRKMPEGRYVMQPDEFDELPGVPEAILQLNRAGLRVIVVTNQRGVALGLYTLTDVNAIHARLAAILAGSGAHIDGIYVCPHDKNQCNCRKPKPGLFEQALHDFPELTATASVMIGDSLSDIEFGRNVGMRTIYIEGDAEHRKPGWEKAAALADESFATLPDAVSALLAAYSPEHA